MSLASYKSYVNDFPVTSSADLLIHDPSGDSGFKCGLEDFKNVLNDREVLYRMIFPSYVALIEDLGRDLIERMLVDKAVSRSHFTGMQQTGDAADAVERYVSTTAVEVWGEAVLKAGLRKWGDVKGGKRGIAEAVTVRNLCAHGIPVFNRKAINRLTAAAGSNVTIKDGTPITLDKKKILDLHCEPSRFRSRPFGCSRQHAGRSIG